MAKKALGRNLGALLGGSSESGATKDGELRKLSIELIQPGKYQPRVDMHADSLDDLAESIRSQGIVQPIVVRPIAKQGHYEIVAGERRWRAAQIAGLSVIPALIRDIPDEAAIAMALIENIQREDLNPIEEARALQRLIEEFEMTHQQAADAVGRSRVTVSNLLRLLTLNDDVRKLLERGDLEMGHARALLGLQGEKQGIAAREVAAKELSVRETERLVRRHANTDEMTTHTKQKPADPDVERLQNELAERLGAKVKFQHGAKGKGKVIIHYNNLDELDGIIAHIK